MGSPQPVVKYQLADQWPDTGKQENDVEMGTRKWHWSAKISNSPNPNMRRIDVKVYRINPGTHRAQANALTTLSGFVTNSGGG